MESEDQDEEGYEDANQAYEEEWQEGEEWYPQDSWVYDEWNNVY